MKSALNRVMRFLGLLVVLMTFIGMSSVYALSVTEKVGGDSSKSSSTAVPGGSGSSGSEDLSRKSKKQDEQDAKKPEISGNTQTVSSLFQDATYDKFELREENSEPFDKSYLGVET